MELSESLLQDINDFQVTGGSLLKIVNLDQSHVTAAATATATARTVGVSAIPSSFPRSCFDRAMHLQCHYNELYVRAASDVFWLETILRPLMQHNALLSSLWRIHSRVKREGAVQPISCGIFRSDYMLHNDSTIKQVEMNTVSCAGAVHAERAAKMHRYLRKLQNPSSIITTLPVNNNTSAIVDVLAEANQVFRNNASRQTCVLMIVQPHNFNVADERPIEYGLWERDIPCFRCELRDVLDDTTLQEDRTLYFHSAASDTVFEVSVVYYRAGYEAREYDDDGEQARQQLELSSAIKCPDVLTHLTTFKAVQKALCEPGAVEHFMPADIVSSIRETFMPMYRLDESEEGKAARKFALDYTTSEQYVLKPNLEGGGHNVYRTDIPDFLSQIPLEDWSQYTLMELIETQENDGVLMTSNGLYRGPVVSELGVLGTCIWERRGDNEVRFISNNVAGWTYKSKPADVDEMSVVKGYGCFDCPDLEV